MSHHHRAADTDNDATTNAAAVHVTAATTAADIGGHAGDPSGLQHGSAAGIGPPAAAPPGLQVHIGTPVRTREREQRRAHRSLDVDSSGKFTVMSPVPLALRFLLS